MLGGGIMKDGKTEADGGTRELFGSRAARRTG